MFGRLFPLISYGWYLLKKEDQHSLHSPYAYHIYKDLISYRKKYHRNFQPLEAKRKKLLQDPRVLTIQDYGAGSIPLKKHKERKVAAMTRHSTSSKRYSLLYQYFCSLTPAQTVLELGTCVGINTCYLSEATSGKLFTFEGADQLADLAQEVFAEFSNIELVRGNISKTLPDFLSHHAHPDFVLIDAHHTYEATLSYFHTLLPYIKETSIVAIGDIHWSAGMEKSWNEIKLHPAVSMSMDFYECGILFFKKGLDQKHYVLHY